MAAHQAQIVKIDAAEVDLTRELGASGVSVLERAFVNLPAIAQIEIARELTTPAPPRHAPAQRDAIELFSTTPEGSELLREWGTQAPLRLANLTNRIIRMTNNMGEATGPFLWALDDLPGRHAKAMWRLLSDD